MSTMSASRRVLTVKQHDRYATTWSTPMDITNATTRLLARRANAPVVELAHTVLDTGAVSGLAVVEHILTGTLPVADYRVELEISRGELRITAPTDHYENLRVISDLD